MVTYLHVAITRTTVLVALEMVPVRGGNEILVPFRVLFKISDNQPSLKLQNVTWESSGLILRDSPLLYPHLLIEPI